MCSIDSRIDRGQLGSAELSENARQWKTKVANAFGQASQAYEQHARVQRCVAQTLARWALELTSPSHVTQGLEIGCGTGFLTREILDAFPNTAWTITDVSSDMLEACRNHPGTLPWLKDDTRFEVVDGEFPSEGLKTETRFNLIVSNMTAQWFANLPAALERLLDLLQPDGWLLFSFPGPDNFSAVVQEFPCLEGRVNSLKTLDETRCFLRSQDQFTFQIREHVTNAGYPDLAAFLASLKSIGANVLREPAPEGTADLLAAIRESRGKKGDPHDNNLLADYRTCVVAVQKRAGP